MLRSSNTLSFISNLYLLRSLFSYYSFESQSRKSSLFQKLEFRRLRLVSSAVLIPNKHANQKCSQDFFSRNLEKWTQPYQGEHEHNLLLFLHKNVNILNAFYLGFFHIFYSKLLQINYQENILLLTSTQERISIHQICLKNLQKSCFSQKHFQIIGF